jgi:hypothetical protein
MPTRLAEETLTKAYERVFAVGSPVGSFVDFEEGHRLPVVNSECYAASMDCHAYVTGG